MVKAGLLIPLIFTWHRLSPLAVFTSGAHFVHKWRQWQSIREICSANFKVLPRNFGFNFQCYTQREPRPTQKSSRKKQLLLSRLLTRKSTRGHSLVQNSFAENLFPNADKPGIETEGKLPQQRGQNACGKSRERLKRKKRKKRNVQQQTWDNCISRCKGRDSRWL